MAVPKGEIKNRHTVSGKLFHPYRHVLDEINIEYSFETRSYSIDFRKIIKNQDEAPLRNFYTRIMVCAIPDDIILAACHHKVNPLSLEFIKFESFTKDGVALKPTVIHQEPSNLELLIWFQDAKTGRAFPLLSGEEIEVHYKMTVKDDIWGPFLLRHIRWDCDQVAVSLTFPKGCVKFWGEMMGVDSPWPAIYPPLARKVGRSELWEPLRPFPIITGDGTKEILRWSLDAPPIGSFFRFSWEFSKEFEKRRLGVVGPVNFPSATSNAKPGAYPKDCLAQGLVSHSEDFRSLYWFGKNYFFSPQQASCIEILWNSWLAGKAGVGGGVLLEAAESESNKLSAIFKRCAAWKEGVIFVASKGIYSLRPPNNLEDIFTAPPICPPGASDS